jgi:putative multiple sugar transport system ATP-binding protein
MVAAMPDPLLEMRGITKRFPGVLALDDVNLRVAEREIHALVGENGAGKSTLMKVLSGVHPAGTYDGEIRFRGRPCRFSGIRQSEQQGIVIIHQELALVPHLSITENMFLGHEEHRFGLINWQRAHARARELLAPVGLTEPPETPVGTLGVGKQQLVEIARALGKNASLLILDEPTASLNEGDSEALLDLLRVLRDRDGLASVLISHKLDEISAVADSITVLRDGTAVETIDSRGRSVDTDRIVRGMVGRELSNRFPPRPDSVGEVLFEVDRWSVGHPTQAGRLVVDQASLTVRRGEVVGVSGLMGAGRTELAMSLFGRSYGRHLGGVVRKEGREVDLSTVAKAIANGVAYVTEDRKTYGLVLIDGVRSNVTLANLGAVSRGSLISGPKEAQVARHYRSAMNIKCAGVEQPAVHLSGGNQQKVVLSKWLFAEPDVLILDEPTRGIDIGAKYEIYTIINRLVAEGKAVVLISSELPEILGMADRIYVMNDGRIIDEMGADRATQEEIMQSIMRDHERRVSTADEVA